MKKFLSFFLSLVLAFGAVFTVFAGAADKPGELRFGSDGKFRILQLSDIQDSHAMLPITRDYIKDAIAAAKPDLIVLTGDNISGGSSSVGVHSLDLQLAKTAINNFMSIIEKSGIPVAVVFGNHDAETTVTKEEQMAIYRTYSCCIAVDEGDSVSGCGTYNLPILASDGSGKTAFNLWMIDSNMYDEVNGGYDHVHTDQINWYIKKSEELKAQNGGNPVPSILFQHIIVPEIFDALLEVPQGTDGAVGHGEKYYVLNPQNTASGELNESPCPPTVNNGQFEAVLKQGDVKAMIFGHDHVNSFVVNYKGIDLITTPGVSFRSYGNHERGARIIDISEDGSYETSLLRYLDLYSENPAALERFVIYGHEFESGEKFTAFFKYIFLCITSIF